jgi:hypothetical protein
VRHSWEEPEGFMEWSVYERIVDGLADARRHADAAEPATVAFMGLGEPLLHPRLVDMVRLATGRVVWHERRSFTPMVKRAKPAGRARQPATGAREPFAAR